MSDDATPPEQTPTPAQLPSEPPQWATELVQELRELPGKLTATITDTDGDKLAEKVYGLFEKGGAFEPATHEPAKDEPTDPPAQPVEPPPAKEPRFRGFARRFAGEE